MMLPSYFSKLQNTLLPGLICRLVEVLQDMVKKLGVSVRFQLAVLACLPTPFITLLPKNVGPPDVVTVISGFVVCTGPPREVIPEIPIVEEEMEPAAGPSSS